MVVIWIPGSLATSYVPVSETHRGGSTDAQGARREGNKGLESTRIPGQDQLHLSGAVQNKMLWEDVVSC